LSWVSLGVIEVTAKAYGTQTPLVGLEAERSWGPPASTGVPLADVDRRRNGLSGEGIELNLDDKAPSTFDW
jgi:hypothetical protein